MVALDTAFAIALIAMEGVVVCDFVCFLPLGIARYEIAQAFAAFVIHSKNSDCCDLGLFASCVLACHCVTLLLSDFDASISRSLAFQLGVGFIEKRVTEKLKRQSHSRGE